jgi:hypothetical protein
MLSNLIGAPRHYVEEMLSRKSLELKKEVKDGDKRICYYGYLRHEEGHWMYVYDANNKLISYKELLEVVKKRAKKSIDEKLNEFVTIGESREKAEENISNYMFLKPVGDEETTEKGVSQQYGMKHYDKDEAIIIVFYDKSGKVLDRKNISK